MSDIRIAVSLVELGAGRPGYWPGENMKRISEVPEMFFIVVPQEDSLVKIHQAGPLRSVLYCIYVILKLFRVCFKDLPQVVLMCSQSWE